MNTNQNFLGAFQDGALRVGEWIPVVHHRLRWNQSFQIHAMYPVAFESWRQQRLPDGLSLFPFYQAIIHPVISENTILLRPSNSISHLANSLQYLGNRQSSCNLPYQEHLTGFDIHSWLHHLGTKENSLNLTKGIYKNLTVNSRLNGARLNAFSLILRKSLCLWNAESIVERWAKVRGRMPKVRDRMPSQG